MKKWIQLGIVALFSLSLLASVTTPASAQKHKDNPNTSQKQDMKSLDLASRNISQAQNQLKLAFAIYKGHRENAYDKTIDAMKELRAAANSTTRGVLPPALPRKELTIAQVSQRDIDESNRHMRTAENNLKQAKHNLEKAKAEYKGHRVAAIRFIDDALKEIKLGLAVNH